MKQKEQPPLGSKKRNQNFISMITKPSSLTEMKIKKIFNSSISTQSGLNTSNCYAKKMKNRNETKTKKIIEFIYHILHVSSTDSTELSVFVRCLHARV